MSIAAAIFLGFIQGAAEFLPISSSGHLSVLQNVFHMQTAEQGHMLFDVMLHLGTLVAILVAYWSDVTYIVTDVVRFFRNRDVALPESERNYPGCRLLLMLAIGTLPLFIMLPFNDLIEQLYYKTWFIGISFLLTGVILYASDRMPRGRKTERTMRVRDALLIGLCQMVATIPGISRSGATITGGIATGQSREYAVKYSLLMSVPAVLGANLLSFFKALKEGVDWSLMPAYLVGTLVAMVVGYFSIALLRRLIRAQKFGKFAYYMWIAGAFALIASLF